MPYRDKNGKWRSQIRVNGKRLPTKYFDTKKAATAYEIEQRELALNPKPPVQDITLLTWRDKYLAHSSATFDDKTHYEKKTAFERLLSFKQINPETTIINFINDFGREFVLEFLTEQMKKRSGYAANKDRKNLLAAWNYAEEYIKGFPQTKKSPFKVRKMPEIRDPRYVPPLDDFWAVFNLAGEQDKVMLLTFLYTAARRGEIFKLTWNDIDFESKTIRLGTKKRENGSMEYDTLPMVDDLAEALKGRFKKSQSFTVFPTEQGREYILRDKFMPKLCKLAGVQHFGYHGIRHLTATVLYHKGCDLSTIQAILRHKSPFTTTRYLKSLGLENVRDSLEMLPKVMEFSGQKKKAHSEDANFATGS